MTLDQFPAQKDESAGAVRPGPWRVTFDTNPDDCNLHCVMCEDHSPYSSTQSDRISAGLPKRRMDIDLIRRVLADSRGTPLREIIPSTMGRAAVVPSFRRDTGTLRRVRGQAESHHQRDVSTAGSQGPGRNASRRLRPTLKFPGTAPPGRPRKG